MALIQCSECNHEVSSKAASCPKCGAPVAKEKAVARAGAKWEGIGFLVMVVASIVGIMTYYDDTYYGSIIGLTGFVVFLIGRFK